MQCRLDYYGHFNALVLACTWSYLWHFYLKVQTSDYFILSSGVTVPE